MKNRSFKIFVLQRRSKRLAKHLVRMRVRSGVSHPELIRAAGAVCIYRGAGIRASKGWTDHAARRSIPLMFSVNARLIGRFRRDVRPLVEMGLISVRVDGTKLTFGKLRVAA